MKYQDKRNEFQQKGQDGTCATVTLESGVVMNAHEYDEEAHGPVKKANSAATPASDDEQKKAAAQAAGNAKADWSKKSMPELKDHLAGKGISFDTNAKKDELAKLCEANP